MNMADDIANLLRRFGANTNGYLEVETALDYKEVPLVKEALPASTLEPVSAIVSESTSVPAKIDASADMMDAEALQVEAIAAAAITEVVQPEAMSVPVVAVEQATLERIEPVFYNAPVVAEVETIAAIAVPVALAPTAAKPVAQVAVVKPVPSIAPVAPVARASSLRSLLTEVALERQAETLAANEDVTHQSTANLPLATPAHVIAVVSPKGGVGKSTITAALTGALNVKGHAIAIDLDPQNALQYHMGVNPDVVTSVNAGLVGENWRAGLLDGVAGTHVLPYGSAAEKERRVFERDLEQDGQWLSKQLAGMNLAPTDTVILDTPPGRTLYMDQALQAADQVVVVITPDAGSFMVLDQIDGLLEGRVDNCRYIVNQFDASRTFCQDMLKVLKRRFGTKLIGVIPLDHAISEGLAFGDLPLLQDDASPARKEILSIGAALASDLHPPVLAGGRAS